MLSRVRLDSSVGGHSPPGSAIQPDRSLANAYENALGRFEALLDDTIALRA